MKYLDKKYWEQFTKIVSINNTEKKVRDGLKFEELIENLLILKFHGKWKRTPKSHDNNRDFYLYSEKERIWAECKNYQTSIAMSTLAPTLVMAQIFDVSEIIFFSYSSINESAKKKIFSFGRKVNKKIRIYDAEILEELIIQVRDYLPKRFRPNIVCFPSRNSLNDINIQMYVRTEPALAIDDEMSDFIPYKNISKIYYNKTFEINFFIFNRCIIDSFNIKIYVIQDESPDIVNFQFLDVDAFNTTTFSKNIIIEGAEGTVIKCLIKPIIYKEKLILPKFRIEIYNNNILINDWKSENVKMNCVWVGQTKLIGSNYEKIIDSIFNKVFLRNKIGVAVIYGESGTGKTRLLTELMDILLQNRYRILNFIGIENDNSLTIIKEIVYFLYEIPRSKITNYWEAHRLDIKSMEEYDSTFIKVFNLLDGIMLTSDNVVLEEYYEIIFEKISQLHVALIFDNVQYYNEKVIHFISKYIKFSLNQNSSNHSIVLCTFNTNFLTEQSNEMLNELRFLTDTTNNIFVQQVFGFQNTNQALLFLRELVHLNTDENDRLFLEIINKVTAKPYYLHQVIKYLEENNAIFHSSLQQGYLIDNSTFRNLIETMPDSITDLLVKRYKKLEEDNHISSLKLILSSIYLFSKIDNYIISVMSLCSECINNLVQRGFLIKLPNHIYTFEHDIIRNFLSEYIPNLEEYCILHILNYGLADKFRAYPFPYACISLYGKHIEKNQFFNLIANIEEENDVPLYLYDNFYKKVFLLTTERKSLFESFKEWLDFTYNICKRIRDKLGSEKALENYYSPLYDILLNNEYECFQNIDIFRSFIMSYSDLLSHLKMNKRAINILKKQLQKAEKHENEFGNSIVTFEAILCNRLHVNYKDFSDDHSQFEQKKYLKMSEKKTKLIKNNSERMLLEFLNYSDKGYCFYCYGKDKHYLLNIWKKCLNYPPCILPEKTLNYYRKCVQINLIKQQYNEVFKNSSLALDYLENGKYSHEKLIFSFYFQMAKCSAYIQTDPIRNGELFEIGIQSAEKMQEILNNGKLRDIYNLKGIYFFYKNQPNEMFLSFRDAYLKYETDSIMTNYSSKLELLIDNIIYAFFKMHIWDNSLYPIYFIEKNKQIGRAHV